MYHITITPVVSCFRWPRLDLADPWSEFVLAELGIFIYESVPFDESSRPFNTREEVEFFYALQRCEDALREGSPPGEVATQLPALCTTSARLKSKREQLQFQLGHLAELAEEWDLALDVYALCNSGPAKIRHARLLERLDRLQEAQEVVARALAELAGEAELQKLARIEARLRRHRGERARSPARSKIVPTDLELEFKADTRVELRVRDHLSTEQSPVFYVENSLICSLFGLLCWPAIFAPIRGAFFHRFHAAPVDLWTGEFVLQRISIFDHCLSELDSGAYRASILDRFADKHGVRSPFVHWHAIQADLLQLSLHWIPAADLKVCFVRLLDNLRENSSGLPDLIQFNVGARGYRMIEVKGPGDQLQDNQRRWLSYCEKHHLPMEVLRVRWATIGGNPIDMTA